jgi:hypothetical protein
LKTHDLLVKKWPVPLGALPGALEGGMRWLHNRLARLRQ